MPIFLLIIVWPLWLAELPAAGRPVHVKDGELSACPRHLPMPVSPARQVCRGRLLAVVIQSLPPDVPGLGRKTQGTPFC